jgi:glycosyltransferase involved in cell wall biosynthesis
MRIAIIGTRGIPANYGGFETLAEELSKRLVARGHDVTVYCRSHYVSRDLGEHNGAKLIVLPTLRHKYLDTVIHGLLSMAHAMWQRYDAILVCNAANAPFVPLVTWTGTPVALNVDGLERKRRKWNALGRAYYNFCERASLWFATEVVTDARVIRDYYAERYAAETTLIVYGATVGRSADTATVAKYGVDTDNYILYVSRLEPENNAAMVIEAFRNVPTDFKLLIVGDAPYADEYKRTLAELACRDARVLLPGAIYGADMSSLRQNAYAYIHATEVGGTHPALIEAMGAGNCCLVYDTPENREVAGDAGIFYSNADELSATLADLLNDPSTVESFRTSAQERVRQNYDWEAVTDEYERLFEQLAGGRR